MTNFILISNPSEIAPFIWILPLGWILISIVRSEEFQKLINNSWFMDSDKRNKKISKSIILNKFILKDSAIINNFKTVKIGNQIWSKENLNVSTFRNGDVIPEAKSKEEWLKAGRENRPIWCFYNFNPEYGEKYGKLYNWFAVNDPRGLSPEGFHIPSKIEWDTLVNFINDRSELKTTIGWENKNGEDSYGFSGRPGGFLYDASEFKGVGIQACWWCSTEKFIIHNQDGSITEELNKLGPSLYYGDHYAQGFDAFLINPPYEMDLMGFLRKDFGFSVRFLLN